MIPWDHVRQGTKTKAISTDPESKGLLKDWLGKKYLPQIDRSGKETCVPLFGLSEENRVSPDNL